MARVWIGYAPSFDAARFDEVPDGRLAGALVAYADDLLRQRPLPPGTTEKREWTEIVEHLGWAHRVKVKDEMWLNAPQWQAFHAEHDPAISRDLIAALHRRAAGDHAFWSCAQLCIKTIAQDELGPSEWSNIERDIDSLDEGWQPSVTTDWGKVYPFNFLANEASELSYLLRTDRSRRNAPESARPVGTSHSGSNPPNASIQGAAAGLPPTHLDQTDEAILRLWEKNPDQRLLTAEIAGKLDRDSKAIGKNLSKLVRIGRLHNLKRKGYKPVRPPQP